MNARSIEELIAEIVRREVVAVLREEIPKLIARTDGVDDDADRLLSSTKVAHMLGTNRRALSERFRRCRNAGSLHALEQMAITVDGVRRWRAADVHAWLRTKGASR